MDFKIFTKLPVLFFLGLFLFGCGKKDKETSEIKKRAPEPPASAQQTVAPPKEKAIYVYSGDRFRDPFTPAGVSSNYQADAIFDPQRATLKGIINGPTTRSAILNVGGTGTYFVKLGRIFDIMGKYVVGYTVKVFDNRVIINGDDDSTYELKIKDVDREAKP